MSETNKEVLDRTSSMLVSGWKMLSIHCPICTFVILSKGDEMKCPKCNLPLIKESNVTTFSNQREEIAVIHEPETETLQTNHLSYEEMRKDYDRRNSRQKLISDALGKKMLSGWTMLGTSCPSEECRGTPLMSLKGQPEMVCVACDKTYLHSALGDVCAIKPDNQKSKRTDTVKSTQPTDSEVSPAFSSIKTCNNSVRPVDPSEKISQKLLQGWSMLSEVCWSNTCEGTVPLMRDLSGKITCVNCGSDPAKFSDKEATPLQKGQPRVENIVEQNSNDHVDEDEDEDSDGCFATILKDVADKYKSEMLAQFSTTKPFSKAPDALPAVSSSNKEQASGHFTDHEVTVIKQIAQEGVDILTKKLKTCLTELGKCEVERDKGDRNGDRDLSRVAKLAEAIEKLCGAHEAIKKLSI